jgi:sulfur carrier protein ThiS
VAIDREPAVTVETFPPRRGYPATEVRLTAGMTLGDLMEILQLPGDTEAVMVNDVYVKPDCRLQDGDRVRIIPFMSGG